MQNVFVEKPYRFVPRFRARWPQWLLLRSGLLGYRLRTREGVVTHEIRQLERLEDSLRAGHGILLAPNHPRTADPLVMQYVARRLNTPFYTMASWHLFNQGILHRCALRWMGAFSVNREGMDRQAIDEAIDILQSAERPLLIFPEGTTSRTNDQLLTLMEGPAFIARTAAKRRAKQGGKVVCHPIAIKYLFQGDLEAAVIPVLGELEHKLTWRPQLDLPLIPRIIQLGTALLTLKELEYRMPPASGLTLRQRQTALVNRLLHPLENEWLGGPQDAQGIALRIKNLRVRIFPEISHARIDPAERRRRWRQLEETYLAQQIDCYPERYVVALPSVDRILETVEKFEEDLTDRARVHSPLKAIIEIGEPIEVATQRERGQTEDPLIVQIRQSLESMLGRLQQESRMYSGRQEEHRKITDKKMNL